jgi:hypothetical protein
MADYSFVSDYLGLSSNLFTYPLILTNLVVPFLFFTYAIYLLLDKLRIFSSESVNAALAVVVSLVSIIFISNLGQSVTAVSIFIICVLKIGGGLKGVAAGIFLALLSLFITPMLVSLLSF